MRFSLIDRIETLEPGSHIAAVKALSMAEEYLGDHFPHFPVMPGVLMLEAMTQASAWLVRATEDFAHSMIVLSESRSVKYGQFVEPGQILRVTAEIASHSDCKTTLKARGSVDGHTTVGGRLVLRRYNLRDEDPRHAVTDALIIGQMRRLFAILWKPQQQESVAPAG